MYRTTQSLSDTLQRPEMNLINSLCLKCTERPGCVVPDRLGSSFTGRSPQMWGAIEQNSCDFLLVSTIQDILHNLLIFLRTGYRLRSFRLCCFWFRSNWMNCFRSDLFRERLAKGLIHKVNIVI